jgi:hypothetical protein
MVVRAKFECISKTQRSALGLWDPKTQGAGHNRYLYDYEFQVVTSGSEENKEFFASTPGGQVHLTAVRGDLYVPGAAYYLDFTPVPPATADEDRGGNTVSVPGLK